MPRARRLAAQIALGAGIGPQQPQDAAVDLLQNSHPNVEHGRSDLVVVVEAAEDEPVLRQPGVAPARRERRNRSLRVVDLVAIGQVDDPLAEERLPVERQYGLVGNHVVDEIGAHRPGISQIVHRKGRRTMRQDSRPAIGRMAFQIDCDVDAKLVDERGGRVVAVRPHVVKPVERRDDARPRRAAVVRAVGNSEHLEAGAIMALEQLGDQVGGRVLVKIRG